MALIEQVPVPLVIVTTPVPALTIQADPVALNVTKPVPFPPEVLAVIPDC